MTCYVLKGTLNPTHSLTHSREWGSSENAEREMQDQIRYITRK